MEHTEENLNIRVGSRVDENKYKSKEERGGRRKRVVKVFDKASAMEAS